MILYRARPSTRVIIAPGNPLALVMRKDARRPQRKHVAEAFPDYSRNAPVASINAYVRGAMKAKGWLR